MAIRLAHVACSERTEKQEEIYVVIALVHPHLVECSASCCHGEMCSLVYFIFLVLIFGYRIYHAALFCFSIEDILMKYLLC